MASSRRDKPSPKRTPDSAPPDPRDQTKLNPLTTGILTSHMRNEAHVEAAARVNHVDHDDGAARAQFVLGPDGIPRLADDEDEPPRENTRVEAPSAALRAHARTRSSRPPSRLVRGADGIARFVDEDANEASAAETTRVDAPAATLLEKTKPEE